MRVVVYRALRINMLVQLYRILKMVSQLDNFWTWPIVYIYKNIKKKIKTKFGNDSRQCWHTELAHLFKTKILSWKQIIYTPCTYMYIYRVSWEECARLRENVPQVKIHRYNPKHLYPKLNGYGDNGERGLKVWQLLNTY